MKKKFSLLTKIATILPFFLVNSLSAEEIDLNDKKVIERYDRDGDGKLNEEELKEARKDIQNRLENCRDKLKRKKRK